VTQILPLYARRQPLATDNRQSLPSRGFRRTQRASAGLEGAYLREELIGEGRRTAVPVEGRFRRSRLLLDVHDRVRQVSIGHEQLLNVLGKFFAPPPDILRWMLVRLGEQLRAQSFPLGVETGEPRLDLSRLFLHGGGHRMSVTDELLDLCEEGGPFGQERFSRR